jgi:hypothetical protein
MQVNKNTWISSSGLRGSEGRHICWLVSLKKYTDIAKQLNITVQILCNYRQHGEFNRKVGKILARENQLRIETQIAISLRNLL